LERPHETDMAGISRMSVLLCAMATTLGSQIGDADRPVTQVVNLLEDMLKSLESEQKEDEDIYDKMSCWCETNDKEKTQAISDAETKLDDLAAEIEELTATSARLGVEITALEKEVAANKVSLVEATEIRAKQHDVFNDEDRDMLEAVTALKSAIAVLAKHHSSFLQRPTPSMLSLATVLREQLQRHADMLKGALSPSQRRALDSFMHVQFGEDPAYSAYTPQSGEIYGILQQLLEEFEADMSSAQKEELERQNVYEDMKAAKTQEIAAGESQLDVKTTAKATADEDKVQAKQDMEDTKAQLSADQQFMIVLKQKCQMTDKDWAARQKVRQEEMAAVTQAIHILSADDARDTFSRTFKPSFFQVGARIHRDARAEAAAVLSRIANKAQNPKIAVLATQVKLDDFTEVKEAIDQMVADLLAEKSDEVKHKDWCVGEMHTNEMMTQETEREKQDQLDLINSLNASIEQLESEIKDLNQEIKDMESDLKLAGEERDAQHKEFQKTVADQRESQRLLQEAHKFLRSFYAKAVFLQSHEQNQTSPKGFDAYETHQDAPTVIGLIEQIIEDAKELEDETTHAEEDAQTAYELHVKDTEASIKATRQSIMNKAGDRAQKEVDLAEATKDSAASNHQLEHLSNVDSNLHDSCDFVLNNFGLRQTARDEEIEALRDARAILSGAGLS